MELLKYLTGEGRVILQAPLIFLSALFLITLGIWGAINWSYSVQISNLNSSIKLKDDTIGSYKDKLSGATPDEAKKRLDSLELQVAALSPRRLTETQIELIVSNVSRLKSSIALTSDMAGPSRLLKCDSKISDKRLCISDCISTPMVLGIGAPPPSGIAFLVRNPNFLTPTELEVQSALRAAGITFDVQPARPKMPNMNDPDMEILVTNK